MAEERNSVNTPPAFTFGNEATLSRSQELFEVASSTSDCCTTIPVATGVGPWNTHYLPADGTSTVSGRCGKVIDRHTHNTETGSAGFTLQAYSSSSGGVDNTVASTSFPPMEQPSDMPGNDTWSATGADAGVQQEFSGACSIVCSSRDALHGRANEHTGDTDQICKSSDLTSVSNSMFIKHCRKSTDGNHKCETCDTSSHLAPPLAAHDRSHEHRSPYHCHICNKSFQSCRHLDDHKRIHKGDKPYTCETCGKSLTQVSHLRAHQQTDATEKPHVCHKCTKPFECKSSLQRHLKWYCGGGDFDCRICHLSFVDSSDLFRHHQMFHGYEMPHECTHCGFDFAEKEALDEHLRRNHMCDLCGATFEDTIQLIKHIWTNSCGQP
ncbi:zinc finger protein 436-like isoform X1 [Dermacentor albipictus]|uniref:zinc finger protein 436-like isoform X1 n=1 Tax=Dermacentor albipictus TaxID=60249 RepID=UPI0038FC4DD1